MIDAALSPNDRWFARGVESGPRGTVTLIDLDGEGRREYEDVSFQEGGRRLAVPSSGEYFLSGSYHDTGLVAYDTEDGEPVWERHDLKKLQSLAIDEREGVAWALFESRGARRVKLSDGRERSAPRGLRNVHVAPDGNRLLLEFRNGVTYENRETGVSRDVDQPGNARLWNAVFVPTGLVLSWSGGPLQSTDDEGRVQWSLEDVENVCQEIEIDRDGTGVWIVDRPYPKPPWYRVRLVAWDGNVTRELRTSFGAHYWLIRRRNLVIRADLTFVDLDGLAGES